MGFKHLRELNIPLLLDAMVCVQRLVQANAKAIVITVVLEVALTDAKAVVVTLARIVASKDVNNSVQVDVEAIVVVVVKDRVTLNVSQNVRVDVLQDVIPCAAVSAQIHVRLLAKVDAQVVAPMVVMHLVEAHAAECVRQVVQVLWLCFNRERNATKLKSLAVWNGKKHYVYCHKGLPISMQVLLSCGKELKGANVLGNSKECY